MPIVLRRVHGTLLPCVCGLALLLAQPAVAQQPVPTLGQSGSRVLEVIPLEGLSARDLETLLYTVSLNGQPLGVAPLLRVRKQAIYARREDWTYWGLRLPTAAPLQVNGLEYWPLSLAEGYVAEISDADLSAAFQFSPAAFASSLRSVNGNRLAEAMRPDGLGGFFNYEAVYSYSEAGQAPAQNTLNGQFELGLFNRWGFGNTQFVGLNLGGADSYDTGLPDDRRRLIRLDSAWRYDDTERMTTLQLGDDIGRAGLWGRAVQFGGVRYGRNFETQPGFVTVPQPALRGESALPTTVDVLIDGVSRQQYSLPPGPFTVDNIPAVNGQGEVQLVVRDLLGREQVFTSTYLSSTQQLKAGLYDYSYEIGALRKNFGRRSNDYGDAVATTQHQYGFSDAFTGEARLELREAGGYGVGGGGLLAVPVVGVLSGALVASHARARDGQLAVLGWQRNMPFGLNFGARALFATRDFRQSGAASDFDPPVAQLGANAGVALPWRARLGLGYIAQRNRNGLADVEAETASLTLRAGPGSLALTAFNRSQPDQDLSVGLTFSMPLGFASRTSASLGVQQRLPDGARANGDVRASLRRSLPDGEGWGWDASALERHDGSGTSVVGGELAAVRNGEHGSAAIETQLGDDQRAVRATVAGGIGAYAGQLFATRRIDNGFAVVESGAADVPLRLNNQPAARTNAAGVAIIPNLQPYQENRILADLSELPLDVEVATGEALATPYYRSGVRVPLAVRRLRSAVVLVQLPDGRAAPAGSVLLRAGDDTPNPVGRGGQVFVSGLAVGSNRLILRTAAGLCALTAELPAEAPVQARLGPYVCEMLKP